MLLRFFRLLFWLWICGLFTSNSQAESKRVLLIHSFGRDFAPLAAVVEGFRSELSRSNSHSVEFLEVSLGHAYLDGELGEKPLVTYLESAYAGAPPSLLVAFGAPALNFISRNRQALFPHVPVLVAGAEKRRVEKLLDQPWLASVHTEWEIPTIVEDIRGLLPDLRHLYVISGSAPVDRFWNDQAKRKWPAVLPGVTIHWMSEKPLAEIENELANAPKGSAIFYGVMTRDAAGILQEYEDALKRLHQVVSAPVFGYSKEQLGKGIVGGSLISMRECGLQGARVAQRILDGESPADIESITIKPGKAVYDWRELKRWDIPHSQLPGNHLLAYQPPTLWESHRSLVLVTATALLALAGGVVLLASARRRVRASEVLLRSTTEAAHVGWWEAGMMGHEIVYVSPVWRAMFGFSEDEVITTEKTLERIHPNDLYAVRSKMEDTMMRDHDKDFEMEYRVKHDDGSVHWLTTRGRAELINGGRRKRMRGVTMDITERKRAEEELNLRRDELAHLGRVAALGELSGALAHELNQPLGSIMSNAQTAQRLLAKDSSDLSMLRDILNDIVAEDQRAADIIQRLRALLERGETEFRPFDVHDGIEKALSLMQVSLKVGGVTVNRKFAETLPSIMADSVQIQQVVINLLSNAIDAIASVPVIDRHVTIHTSVVENGVAVEVEDHGCGFALTPEECFQPFNTTKRDGLGMGLAVCRSIIEAHKGKISALPPPAGGAIVRFTIPTSPLP